MSDTSTDGNQTPAKGTELSVEDLAARGVDPSTADQVRGGLGQLLSMPAPSRAAASSGSGESSSSP